MQVFTGVKVFSATMVKERNALGEVVTAWLAANSVEVVETVVRQSSDSEYHCISITLFYVKKKRKRVRA